MQLLATQWWAQESHFLLSSYGLEGFAAPSRPDRSESFATAKEDPTLP